jgi:hypothetical protein
MPGGGCFGGIGPPLVPMSFVFGESFDCGKRIGCGNSVGCGGATKSAADDEGCATESDDEGCATDDEGCATWPRSDACGCATESESAAEDEGSDACGSDACLGKRPRSISPRGCLGKASVSCVGVVASISAASVRMSCVRRVPFNGDWPSRDGWNPLSVGMLRQSKIVWCCEGVR